MQIKIKGFQKFSITTMGILNRLQSDSSIYLETAMSPSVMFLFLFFSYFTLFYVTILYWFCHTSTWICHGCTRVPNPEPLSHLLPHTISLGHPSAPAPSILYPASNHSFYASCLLPWNRNIWRTKAIFVFFLHFLHWPHSGKQKIFSEYLTTV